MMMTGVTEFPGGGVGGTDEGPGVSEYVHPTESIRETVESVIVALILAFVFRAFIVEAFVIPTGSMAPTLYGAHGTLLCEDCGVEFAYGVRDLDDSRRPEVIGERSRAICPNCNHSNTKLRINDVAHNAETGDRILVLKWPLDTGIAALGPQRWDVTVFKDPADGKTNFIKRLAGLPDEVLMILDGDIYSVPTSELTKETVAKLERIREEKYRLRSTKKRERLSPPPASVLKELDEKMKVARKTPAAQKALWFSVYNHDYPPRTLDPDQPRWQPGARDDSGWDATKRRVVFRDKGIDEDFIELARKEIRASCAYNIQGRLAPYVSDLRVSFVMTVEAESGSVSVSLSKRNRAFRAEIRADGSISIRENLTKAGAAKVPIVLTGRIEPLVPGEPIEVSFENVDYRLSLHVGGEEVLSTSTDRSSPAYYGPNIGHLRRSSVSPTARSPRIFAKGGDFLLTHLLIERDEHYYNDSSRSIAGFGPVEGWGGRNSPILLRHDEYFMLGDNTAASKDSRLWDVTGSHLVDRGDAFQLGTVPADQLIGRAFFVYWPSGHRIEWLPVVKRFGVIPDVGRMRWIR